MRSVLSAGLLDHFLEQGFNPCGLYFGISAGALNLTTFLAESPGESLRVYTEFALHTDVIRCSRFLAGGHLLDLDWLVENFLEKTRLDLQRIHRRGKRIFVGVTDVESDKARYIDATPNNLAPEVIQQWITAADNVPATSDAPILFNSRTRPMLEPTVPRAEPIGSTHREQAD